MPEFQLRCPAEIRRSSLGTWLRIVSWLGRNIGLVSKLRVDLGSRLGVIGSGGFFFPAIAARGVVIGVRTRLCFACSLCVGIIGGGGIRAGLGTSRFLGLRRGSAYASNSTQGDECGGACGNSGAVIDHWSLSTMCASFLILRSLRVLRVLRRTPLWRKPCAIPTAIVYYFCLLTSPKVFTCVYFPFIHWDFLLYLPKFPNLIHSNKTGQYPHSGAGVNIPIS